MWLVKDYVVENKKKLLIVAIVIVVLSVCAIYVNSKKGNKIYFSNDYVYTNESHNYSDDLYTELPYINVKGDEVREINNLLIKDYYEMLELEEQVMSYDYYKTNNIISLIVKKHYIDAFDSYPVVDTYNIDINNGTVLDNNELLNLYSISNYEISEIIDNKIREYYNYELRNKYIDKTCDYDCYLADINGLPLDDCKLYVKDNILYAFKKLNVDMDFYYDPNSGFDLFNFKIK